MKSSKKNTHTYDEYNIVKGGNKRKIFQRNKSFHLKKKQKIIFKRLTTNKQQKEDTENYNARYENLVGFDLSYGVVIAT